MSLKENFINTSDINKSTYLPPSNLNRNYFICNILNPSIKNDMASMEHPIFSLSTKPVTETRLYEHNGNIIEVIPSVLGLATIWDKDILLYCLSQIREGMNKNRSDVSKLIRIIPYDLLKYIGRSTGGTDYKRLKAALKRIAGTQIITNIETNNIVKSKGFPLIGEWEIAYSSNGRMEAIYITLSEWLYNAALGKEILTLDKEYFSLRKGLERRLYELARKHCGSQPKWNISLELLLKKSGSQTLLKAFRNTIKIIVEKNHLPDYKITYDRKRDQVCFYNRNDAGHKEQVKDAIQGILV